MSRPLLHPGIAAALGAALLFGTSTPLAKLLVGSMSAFMLAGLLYLGSGITLFGWFLTRRLGASTEIMREAPLTRADVPWLVGATATGGVIGPVLLLLGLANLPAAGASLLLNLEAVFTALLAWFVFRENVDRRVALGMFFIVAGGVLLSWRAESAFSWSAAALLIAGACLAWAIDNNLTRKISAGDPVLIAGVKGLIAGLTNTAIALIAGGTIPTMPLLAGAGVVGALGYGLSLVLFVLALRHLGAARTGAYFSTAPFIGAALAIALFTEPLAWSFWPAAALMALGVWLHLTERHEHMHEHARQMHSHSHTHDLHHQHAHAFLWDGQEPHTHAHTHVPLVHSHPHYPDIHHQHRH